MILILDKQNRFFALIKRSVQLQAWLHHHRFARVVQIKDKTKVKKSFHFWVNNI